MTTSLKPPKKLLPEGSLGRLERAGDFAPLRGSMGYLARETGDGLIYRFPAGTLAKAKWLTYDTLIDGNHLMAFSIELQEGEDGPRFGLRYKFLTQCGARVRFDLAAVNQNRWRYPREGAWLKPICFGALVDLRKVDRLRLTVLRMSDVPAKWCMTPLVATVKAPPLMKKPLLPKGPLLDELGQSTIHDWPAKTRSVKELKDRLRRQAAEAPRLKWPKDFSRWGGWLKKRFDATGFFHTHHDGRRWWLVDPDGYAYWSAGMNCVSLHQGTAAYAGLKSALTWLPPRPQFQEAHTGWKRHRKNINYLIANFIRAFGKEHWRDKWSAIALAEMRSFGFNTVANWSDWKVAQAAGFPYVRPLWPRLPNTPFIFRDMPDVFHPNFAKDAAAFAQPLQESHDDPAFLGYFLMNEPEWGFAEGISAAEGMLFNTPSCATRKALVGHLKKKYGAASALAKAWGIRTSFAAVADGKWETRLTDAAKKDLETFSTIMVDKLFRTLSDACKAVDPNHINLGARYFTVPPKWALDGMGCFDVFSVNCYREQIPAALFDQTSRAVGKPILAGEWHFGALDAGLPASGIGRVKSQKARGQAFRVYTETAAAAPSCVGVHYFTQYDQSPLGRDDGENYNIGFMDNCNRPYGPLAKAARASHERLYRVAAGQLKPFTDAPEYLPKVF